MARPPTAVLFDVDGTLIDSHALYLESYRRALKPVLGYAPDDGELLAHNPSSERNYLIEWLGAEKAEDAHRRMCAAYEELHPSMCEGIYDGIREMLKGLRSAGIRTGVVTGKGRYAWEVTARHFDFGPMEVVITEDDVADPKPSPEGLHSAVEVMGLDASEVLYIGDSVGDMDAGRRAGMQTGAALWPKTADGEVGRFRGEIEKFSPTFHFDRPADVVRQIAAWC